MSCDYEHALGDNAHHNPEMKCLVNGASPIPQEKRNNNNKTHIEKRRTNRQGHGESPRKQAQKRNNYSCTSGKTVSPFSMKNTFSKKIM